VSVYRTNLDPLSGKKEIAAEKDDYIEGNYMCIDSN